MVIHVGARVGSSEAGSLFQLLVEWEAPTPKPLDVVSILVNFGRAPELFQRIHRSAFGVRNILVNEREIAFLVK